MSAAGVVVVFAKAPRPGRVKTRLTPPLAPEQAAELYATLLGDVLAATERFARELELEPIVAVDPPDACPEIARRAPTRYSVVAQRGRDLSRRMAWAVDEAAARGARRILLRGSDSPALDGAVFADALAALEGADLVLCPDRDGGYNLVGLRKPAPGLFDHAMSTASVLEDTLANARELGLRACLRRDSFDLDTVGDLRWLAAAREQGAAALCPNTLAYLDRNDLWRFTEKSARG